MVNRDNYFLIQKELEASKAKLVAVSKLKPIEDIQALYELGQRDFGENYVQELVLKQPDLPADIHWHFIGHLQSNKVKYIAPFVHTIHGVDSYKLLQEVNKQAQKSNRNINCLLQVHIAQEETKFGLDEKELLNLLTFYEHNKSAFANISITGLMGMASFVDDESVVGREFEQLRNIFNVVKNDTFLANTRFNTLSMGMTDDYKIALKHGSTLVRIGRALFGSR